MLGLEQHWSDHKPIQKAGEPNPNLVVSVKPLGSIILLVLVGLGRFSAKLGPATPPNGSGSNNDAAFTQNQPRTPIINPFRGQFLVRAKKLKCKMHD